MKRYWFLVLFLSGFTGCEKKTHKDDSYYLEDIQFKKGENCYMERDYSCAHQALIPIAKEGNHYAQSLLGDMYYSGQGVARNYEKAMQWYLKSAKHGNANAQVSIGNLYLNGQGVKQNTQEALEWFHKQEQRADVQVYIGLIYYDGQGVDKDYKKALSWLTKAVEEGSEHGYYSTPLSAIGNIYAAGGNGVIQDYKKAAQWYQQAAELNDETAQYKLAELYLQGSGVTKNKTKALELLDKSCSRMYLDSCKKYRELNLEE